MLWSGFGAGKLDELIKNVQREAYQSVMKAFSLGELSWVGAKTSTGGTVAFVLVVGRLHNILTFLRYHLGHNILGYLNGLEYMLIT